MCVHVCRHKSFGPYKIVNSLTFKAVSYLLSVVFSRVWIKLSYVNFSHSSAILTH